MARVGVREIPEGGEVVTLGRAAEPMGALGSVNLAAPQTVRLPPEVLARAQAITYALAVTLGARILLFMALIGAFVLGVMAMNRQSPESIIILGVFCVLAILPLTWLYGRRPG